MIHSSLLGNVSMHYLGPLLESMNESPEYGVTGGVGRQHFWWYIYTALHCSCRLRRYGSLDALLAKLHC